MTVRIDADLEDRLKQIPLAEEPFFLTARLSAQGSGAANRVLTPFGLKVRHYSLLSIACSDENPTQREVSQFLVLDPSQVVSLVDDLEKLGAVERIPDPRDRRSKIIVATDAGRELHRETKALVDDAGVQSLSRLTPAEQAEFLRLLRKATLD